MFKLLPRLPGHLGQLIMHFESDRDACLIVAMAVPVIEFAFLFVTDFPHIVCYFFKNFCPQEEKFLQKNPFPITCTTVA